MYLALLATLGSPLQGSHMQSPLRRLLAMPSAIVDPIYQSVPPILDSVLFVPGSLSHLPLSTVKVPLQGSLTHSPESNSRLTTNYFHRPLIMPDYQPDSSNTLPQLGSL